jgi:hypothetical protein
MSKSRFFLQFFFSKKQQKNKKFRNKEIGREIRSQNTDLGITFQIEEDAEVEYLQIFLQILG